MRKLGICMYIAGYLLLVGAVIRKFYLAGEMDKALVVLVFSLFVGGFYIGLMDD